MGVVGFEVLMDEWVFFDVMVMRLDWIVSKGGGGC